MSTEQAKERVKLKTEFLKFYFILLIALGTGVGTLVVKESLSPIQSRLMNLGACSIILIVFLIAVITRQIKQLISKIS